MIDPLW